MKFWNKARVKRVRDRERAKDERRHKAAKDAAKAAKLAKRSYTVGEHEKNVALALDALGNPDRRRMINMLRQGGEMSLSTLAEAFSIKLPTAHAHIEILEQAGIVTTHKKGRVRMCVYNSEVFKELSKWLTERA